MRDAVELHVSFIRRKIVEQKDSAAPACEEMFQCKDLTAIAQRILSQQAHLGKTVEYDAGGVDLRDPIEYHFGRFTQFQFGWME